MPWLWSGRSSTVPAAIARSKLGHPDPESNFAPVENSTLLHPAHRNTPSSSTWRYLPVHAGSVPRLRSTSYWSGESRSRHSSSVSSSSCAAMGPPRRVSARCGARATTTLPARAAALSLSPGVSGNFPDVTTTPPASRRASVPAHVAWVARPAGGVGDPEREERALLALVDAALGLGVGWLTVQDPTGGRALRDRAGELAGRGVAVAQGTGHDATSSVRELVPSERAALCVLLADPGS